MWITSYLNGFTVKRLTVTTYCFLLVSVSADPVLAAVKNEQDKNV